MPVSPAFAESNRRQTERLRKLVDRLDAEILAVRLPNGWTVAVALAHIAFLGPPAALPDAAVGGK